jgi:N-acetylglutamate synthase
MNCRRVRGIAPLFTRNQEALRFPICSCYGERRHMRSGVSTREFRIDDYQAALELWERVGGIEIAEGDSREDIASFVLRNPGLSRVAADSSRIVGVALCGHDGHRGHIYHLAVDPDVQGLGLGKRLVDECLNGLRSAGLKRAIILVANDNPRGQSFWRRCGWEDVPGADVMGIDL